MYQQMYGTAEHFEVIYISLDCIESAASFDMCIREMPWLIHSFVPEFAARLISRLFGYASIVHFPTIAAFGPHWDLVGKESNLAFKKTWDSKYPFVAKYSAEEEIQRDLSRKYGWDLERLFPFLRKPSSEQEVGNMLKRCC